MAKKVVLVDDDIAILDVFSAILRFENYTVITYSTGFGIIERIIKDKPDLILLDFSLPGQTGDVIAKKLRELPETKNIPIVMLSAYPAIEKIALASGVNAFVSKPCSIDDIIAAISRSINQLKSAAEKIPD